MTAHYITDADGNRTGIMLDVETYRSLLEAHEEVEDIRAAAAAKADDPDGLPLDQRWPRSSRRARAARRMMRAARKTLVALPADDYVRALAAIQAPAPDLRPPGCVRSLGLCSGVSASARTMWRMRLTIPPTPRPSMSSVIDAMPIGHGRNLPLLPVPAWSRRPSAESSPSRRLGMSLLTRRRRTAGATPALTQFHGGSPIHPRFLV
jgi:hypothetical protein